MRLLRLEPTKRTWLIESFSGPKIPFYAVLSHTWGPDNAEVKFEDIQDGSRSFDDTSKAGYDKLRFCHNQSQKSGLLYFWIDTCCIKKSDSSELALSLNSMFYWYQRSAICYVYLSDVSIEDTTDAPGMFKWEQAFKKSRWFRRGWTLQELLAPSSVAFFSKEQHLIGNKNEEWLAKVIANVTPIPTPALRGVKLSLFSRRTRMSWASGRETTVPEDAAYCLIGIFDLQLHTLYADGEFEKRKNVALAELDRELKLLPESSTEDVIRIGGACYNDLSRLGQRQLLGLDKDLDEYQEWLLNEYPTTSMLFRAGAGQTEFSEAAGKRLKELLAKYKVQYEDLSDLEGSWQEPWNVYKDKNASPQARVQGLLQNRCYWTRKNEKVYSCITALRTLEELMVWRGRWQK